MANNQYVNKVVYGTQIILDLTGDTITDDKLLAGYTAHDASGKPIIGTCTFDVNSQDADIKVAEMLVGKTAYARGTKLTGTMPSIGAITKTITTKDQVISIPTGYHDGSGTVSISPDEAAKIIAENIRQGVVILGVEGTMSGTEEVKAQSVTATPTSVQQTILPNTSEGYNYIAQVVVEAIPYAESDNSAGGKTVTIG